MDELMQSIRTLESLHRGAILLDTIPATPYATQEINELFRMYNLPDTRN